MATLADRLIARVAARFWAKVDRDGPVPSHRPELGPCWIWTGAISKQRDERGIVRITGRNEYAHRIAFELEIGPIPEGLQVLHRCDEGLCVRPEHLMTGTHADNMRDMAAKGRAYRGGPKPKEAAWQPSPS